MASNPSKGNDSQLLLVGDTGGITVINPSTPLKRLNYFDGKFLRAADFDVEQRYLRQLVALSNQGLGPGVVYGYDTTLGNGDTVQIGPGLAIDPSGKVLLLQTSLSQSIQALIDASKKVTAKAPDASGKTGPGAFSDCVQVAAPPPVGVFPVSDIYVIVICSAEALCGQEDVFGVLCQDACITSTDRPYRLDGIVVRAIPLQLVTPFPHFKGIDADLYLRSKVAHSWFADEARKHPDAISRAGARGLMQVMPGTAREAAGQMRLDWSDRLLAVPDANLHVGAAHFASLLRHFRGDPVPALAAYNAGLSPVERWRRVSGTRDPALFVERIPYAETRGYVRSVLRNWTIYRALYPQISRLDSPVN